MKSAIGAIHVKIFGMESVSALTALFWIVSTPLEHSLRAKGRANVT